MSKPIITDTLWAGTELSLAAYTQQIETAETRFSAGLLPSQDNGDQEDQPHLLSVRDGVGVISIRGSMTNRTDPWLRFFGITTYSDIRDALVAAANDTSVKQILLDIDSGGGAVSGVADVSSLISTINEKVKPVSAFSDGVMASAAYWLGSSAGKVYASKVAMVGSIGVIATHMEYSKAYRENGVGVTVLRAGKYKALANSAEPLSEIAKEQIQEGLDAAYQVFVSHVADARGTSYAETNSRMAQGREFFGEHAFNAGLVDGIDTFDGVFGRLSNVSIDNRTHIAENSQKFRMTSSSPEVSMARQALTEQQIAALAEGAPAASAPAAEATPAAAEAAPAAAEAAPAAAEAAPAAAETTPAAAETTPAAAEAAPAAAAADASVVSMLQAQLKAANDELVSVKIANASLTERLAAADGAQAELVAIASRSINNMTIALGGSAVDHAAMAPAAVAAEHKRVSAQFSTKFQAGGVAAVDAASSDAKEPVLHPLHMARIAATRVK